MKLKLAKPVAKRKRAPQPTVAFETSDGRVRTYGVQRVKDCIRWKKTDKELIQRIANEENRFMVQVVDEILDAGFKALGYR